ncbi:MAG: alpha-L-glutamate ligase-like protein [Planctomycetes bacterium]|nr:alpha-L-glutamate ligase-like protein [Planctomycetota bacterium]
MRWLLGGRRLRQLGILGINRRNAECILDHNPRSRFSVVDDKLEMAELCRRIGVPTPAIHGVLSTHGELPLLEGLLYGRSDFVLKPARGSGGRGIAIIEEREDDRFRRSNGKWTDLDGLHSFASDILSGMFSLGGQPDRVLLQQRVRAHPCFAEIAPRGVADVRIILYRFEPAMAMLRLPTYASNGRANLHQGGIGVGVDIERGTTHLAVHGDEMITRHPDTRAPLLDRQIPAWGAILDMARVTARAVGLGFIGIDIVIDESEGPLLLEANARPGLTIQLANQRGLREMIEQIDAREPYRRGS